jgi:hypothetical protein
MLSITTLPILTGTCGVPRSISLGPSRSGHVSTYALLLPSTAIFKYGVYTCVHVNHQRSVISLLSGRDFPRPSPHLNSNQNNAINPARKVAIQEWYCGATGTAAPEKVLGRLEEDVAGSETITEVGSEVTAGPVLTITAEDRMVVSTPLVIVAVVSPGKTKVASCRSEPAIVVVVLSVTMMMVIWARSEPASVVSPSTDVYVVGTVVVMETSEGRMGIVVPAGVAVVAGITVMLVTVASVVKVELPEVEVRVITVETFAIIWSQ